MLSVPFLLELDAPPHEQIIDNTEKTRHKEIINLLILSLFNCKIKSNQGKPQIISVLFYKLINFAAVKLY